MDTDYGVQYDQRRLQEPGSIECTVPCTIRREARPTKFEQLFLDLINFSTVFIASNDSTDCSEYIYSSIVLESARMVDTYKSNNNWI